jgi:hypothetical protein
MSSVPQADRFAQELLEQNKRHDVLGLQADRSTFSNNLASVSNNLASVSNARIATIARAAGDANAFLSQLYTAARTW